VVGEALIRAAGRHDRLVLISVLLLVVLLSWIYLLSGAGMTQEMAGMLMPMGTGPWTFGYAAAVAIMWIAMMAAMMLPSAVPAILLHATIVRGRGAGAAPATACFALGYFAVWAIFSLAAATLQFALESVALLSPMMKTSSISLAGAVLIAAGAYQWTPLKQACLRHCRSPLEFISTYWRPGTGGAFFIGFRHGLYCLGCCWMLMLLLFVGGVMNLVWISGIALFVLVEKLIPAGHWIGRTAGTILVVWGVATLFASR
jgi:predicted metal-binding membrane protein